MIELFHIGDAVPDLLELEGTSFLPLLVRPTLAPSLWKNASFTQCECSPPARRGSSPH